MEMNQLNDNHLFMLFILSLLPDPLCSNDVENRMIMDQFHFQSLAHLQNHSLQTCD